MPKTPKDLGLIAELVALKNGTWKCLLFHQGVMEGIRERPIATIKLFYQGDAWLVDDVCCAPFCEIDEADAAEAAVSALQRLLTAREVICSAPDDFRHKGRGNGGRV